MSSINLPVEKTGKLSSAEVCKILAVSRETLETLRRQPDFPVPFRYTPGGRLLFEAQEIFAWQESKREPLGGDGYAK